MQATIDHLEKIVRNYAGRMQQISAPSWTHKPAPDKWSKQEILGHLIDSAQNNIRRAIVAQYEDSPSITYRQDDWVTMAGYQDHTIEDMIGLWSLLNRHFAQILRHTTNTASTRKLKMGAEEPVTIDWMAADYCNHLLHHLHQILDLDPIAYP